MEEGMRFELTVRCRTPAFQAGTFSHSATLPQAHFTVEQKINTGLRLLQTGSNGRGIGSFCYEQAPKSIRRGAHRAQTWNKDCSLLREEIDMATLIETRSQTVISPGKKTKTTLYVSHWAVVLGRTLFSAIFILSAPMHFRTDTIFQAAAAGVPFANIIVPFSGMMALLGGLSILLGYYEKIGAVLLMLFLVPVTLTMHAFWAEPNPLMAQMQMANFMKNLALFGGLMLIYQFATDPVRATRRTITRKPRTFKPSFVGGPGYTE
jgi:putative oxidoreductase